MAYSDFTTIRQVEKQFGVRQIRKQVFTDVKQTLPSPRLLEELQEAEDLPLFSEKAKSELIIMPILKEIRRKNRTFNIFSPYFFQNGHNNQFRLCFFRKQRQVFCFLQFFQ